MTRIQESTKPENIRFYPITQIAYIANAKTISILIMSIAFFTASLPLFAALSDAQAGNVEAVMNTYFAGEKTGSLVKIAVAIVSAAVGIFLFRKNQFGKGLAIPLVLIAAVELTVGGTIYLRTDGQLAALVEQFRSEPAAYLTEELARMSGVISLFATLRILQIGIAIAGVILFLFAKMKKRPTLQGAGTGLIVTGLILLVMDLLGNVRAEIYMDTLSKLSSL